MTFNGFLPMPARLHGEVEERQENGKRALRYHLAFLDDYLKGILPNDLILLSAPTGIGKTDMAMNIATTNAMLKRRVSYFALEAEMRELERRTKYTLVSTEAHRNQHPLRSDLNYADWLMGRCEHIVGQWNAKADQQMLEMLSGLSTFYRGAKFGIDDLHRQIQEIHKFTDLIIVDHLHYIDTDVDESENRSMSEMVKTLREIAITIGKPILLVAHLRKKDQRGKQIISTIDDVHGSSNITKICTQAVIIERAGDIQSPKWFLSPTFMTIPKDRRLGRCPFVALCYYDIRTRGYAPHYALGRLVKGGTEWEELQQPNYPSWAKHAKELAAS